MKERGISLYRIVQVIAFFLFIIMTTVVFWQVIARYFLRLPMDWSSELAKILMVWITFLGVILAFYDHSHPCITFLVDKFPSKLRKAVDLVLNIFLLFGFIVVTYMGFQLCLKTHNKVTTVLKMPMSVEYAALPIATGIMALKVFEDFAKLIIEKVKGEQN